MFEKSIAIIDRTYSLDMERINRDAMFEFGMAEVNGAIPQYMFAYYEAPAAEGTAKNPFLRIIDAIKRFLSDLAASIADAFGKENDYTAIDDYLRSQPGKVQLSYDLNEVESRVDAQLRQGRKLLQFIAKHGPLDDKTLLNFADKCASAVMDNQAFLKVGVKLAVVETTRAKACGSTFKKWEKELDQTRELNRGAFFSQFSLDDGAIDPTKDRQVKKFLKEEEKRLKKQEKANAAVNTKKAEQQRLAILNSMSNMVHKGGNAFAKVAGEVRGVYNNARQKMKREKKD